MAKGIIVSGNKETWVRRTILHFTEDTSVTDVACSVQFAFKKSYITILSLGDTANSKTSYTYNMIVGMFHDGQTWIDNAISKTQWIGNQVKPSDFLDKTVIPATNVAAGTGTAYAQIQSDGTILKTQYGVNGSTMATNGGTVIITETALEEKLWGEV